MGGWRLRLFGDQILAVSGTLDLTTGGPSVRPFIDPDLWQSSTSRVWGGRPVGDPTTWRRSVYVFNKRSIRYPMFEAFDQPDMTAHCSERVSSTVAPQALLLMNNAEVLLQSKFLAQRLQLEAGTDTGAQVDRAFELALARSPSRGGAAAGRELHRGQYDGFGRLLPDDVQPERIRVSAVVEPASIHSVAQRCLRMMR